MEFLLTKTQELKRQREAFEAQQKDRGVNVDGWAWVHETARVRSSSDYACGLDVNVHATGVRLREGVLLWSFENTP